MLQQPATNGQDENDIRFMREALRQAQYAFDAGEVPVGAVVVCNNHIIARGHNQVEQLNDSTAHAEMIALTAAFNVLGAKYLPEATLYVTLEPCLMCCGALFWSKTARVVYGAPDIRHGYSSYAGTQPQPLFHPRTTVTGGILAAESTELIKKFFAERRGETG